jgi:hypothetical protein
MTMTSNARRYRGAAIIIADRYVRGADCAAVNGRIARVAVIFSKRMKHNVNAADCAASPGSVIPSGARCCAMAIRPPVAFRGGYLDG